MQSAKMSTGSKRCAMAVIPCAIRTCLAHPVNAPQNLPGLMHIIKGSTRRWKLHLLEAADKGKSPQPACQCGCHKQPGERDNEHLQSRRRLCTHHKDPYCSEVDRSQQLVSYPISILSLLLSTRCIPQQWGTCLPLAQSALNGWPSLSTPRRTHETAA